MEVVQIVASLVLLVLMLWGGGAGS